eukprot:7219752-Ditylum_brightwellii.AAC.1
MPYTEGQQVEVWIDRNNLHPWCINPTQNWQWTPALVTIYYYNPPCVRCLVASPPYVCYPVFTSSLETTHSIDIANMMPLGDAAAGFGV